MVRESRNSQSPSRDEVEEVQGRSCNQPAVLWRCDPISVCGKLTQPDDLDVTAADLSGMGCRESHRELRPDVHAQQLEAGYPCSNRRMRQRQHDPSDMDPVGISRGRGGVDTLGQAAETGALERLRRQPERPGLRRKEGSATECRRYQRWSHQETMRLAVALLMAYAPICG